MMKSHAHGLQNRVAQPSLIKGATASCIELAWVAFNPWEETRASPRDFQAQWSTDQVCPDTAFGRNPYAYTERDDAIEKEFARAQRTCASGPSATPGDVRLPAAPRG